MPKKNIDIKPGSGPHKIGDEVPEQYRDQVAAIEEDLEYLEQLGSEFFPLGYWQQLPDDKVLEVFASEFTKAEGEIGILGEEVRKLLEEWIPKAVPSDQWNDPRWRDVWVALTAAAQVSLLQEYHRRRLSVENAWGQAV